MNKYVVRSTIVGALGGLLFGFDTAVISGAEAGLRHSFGLSEWWLGFAVSIALWGTVAGALTAGSLGQRYGSREMLRLTAVLYVISAIGCAFAPNLPVFLIARFLGGLGIGASSVLGPVYIAELAPAHLRGRLVGTFQINIVIGILLAYLSNYIISIFNFGAREWRWELGVAAFPAILFLILLYTIPRSARWLATQNRTDEAREVLKLMGSSDSNAELQAILDSLRQDQSRNGASLFERIHGRFRYGRPIFLAIAIGAFNQFSGINAILYYLNRIFTTAGSSAASSNLKTVAVGGMNLLATFVGMALIDRLGRKVLLLIGAAGTSICLAVVAWIFFVENHQAMLVWALLVYIGFFAVSQGAVIWVYLSEVFPTRVRGKGQSLGAGTHWVMSGILSQLFPVVAKHSGAYPFIFFSVMTVVQFVVVLFYFPETKRVSLEQLQVELKIV